MNGSRIVRTLVSPTGTRRSSVYHWMDYCYVVDHPDQMAKQGDSVLRRMTEQEARSRGLKICEAPGGCSG